MRKEKDFVLEDNIDICDVASYLSDYLKKDSTALVTTSCSEQEVILNCKTSSRFKTFFGLSRRYTITLSLEGNRCHIIADFSYKTQMTCFFTGLLLALIPPGIGVFMIPTSIFGAVRLFLYQSTFLHHLEQHISQEGITKTTDGSYALLWENNTAADIYKMAVKLDGENKKRSFALYNLAAEKGITEAILKVGLRYYDGEGVKQNFKKAYSLWNRRPQELCGEAALKFGDMHRDGNCTEKDLKKAFQFYRQASKEDFEQRVIEVYEQGTDLKEYRNAAAQIYEKRFGAGERQLLDKIIDLYTELKNEKKVQQYKVEKAKCGDTALALNLGKKLYEEGGKEAVALLEQAIPEEDPIALRMLGEAYLKGKLVQKDEKKAIDFLQKAVTKGSFRAAELLVLHHRDDGNKLVNALEQMISLAMDAQCADKLQDFVLHEAQSVLAGLYCTGGKKGDVPKDISKSIELYKKAIKNGNAGANLILAGLYCTDKYVKADLDRAISYCQKAAEANVKEAEHWLRQCQIEKAKNGDVGLALSLGKKLYDEGQKEAVELLEIAASKSDPVALRMLGEAYWRGELVPEDNKKAVSWLQKAAQKGSLFAAELLVTHYEEYEKDEVKLLKALERKVSLAASEKCVDKDEDFVLSDDLYDLAWLYCSGGENGKIARDVPKGIELFEKAIELGDMDSYLALAEIYSEEEYGTVDYDRAISYCRKAVEANVDEAEDVLQEILQEQKEALKQEDLKKLLDNYKSDSTGETSLALAKIYEEGEEVEKDEAKAVSFYQEAAKQGNAEAVYNLGRVAENGIDMDGDIAQALQLYELAGKLGYSPAFEALDQLQEQLATCREGVIDWYSGKHADYDDWKEYNTRFIGYVFINFMDIKEIKESKEIIVDTKEQKKIIAFSKHLSSESSSMAFLYYAYALTKRDGQVNFAQKYRNSNDPSELTLALYEAICKTKDNDDAWYFLERLFAKNVYWPLFMLISVKLREITEEGDGDDEKFTSTLTEVLLVCAAGGVLEALGFCSKLEINFDDPVRRKRLEEESARKRPDVIAKLKDIFQVFPFQGD